MIFIHFLFQLFIEKPNYVSLILLFLLKINCLEEKCKNTYGDESNNLWLFIAPCLVFIKLDFGYVHARLLFT